MPNQQLWQGRIDTTTNRSGFRLHQVIQIQAVDDVKDKDNTFSFIGFASDEGVKRNKGRTGAAMAPDKIRTELAKLPYGYDLKTKLIDVGNVVCENDELEKAQEELGNQIYKLFQQRVTPIIIGGGHETLYGHYLGARKHIGPERTLGIINIDAHFDLRHDEIPSSGTMFRQILEQDKRAGYLCLGIQEFGNTRLLFETADRFGCAYVQADDIRPDNIWRTLEKIDLFAGQYEDIIVTLCTDSIMASAAPGVSAPSPMGLDPQLVKRLLKYTVARKNVRSFDISEVNPLVDENGKTVKLAAYLIAETMKSFHKN